MARKDVERTFRILQSQFTIVRFLARFWDQEILWYIMTACVTMHNMIIQDERDIDKVYGGYDLMGRQVRPERNVNRIASFLEAYHDIREFQKDLTRGVVKVSWHKILVLSSFLCLLLSLLLFEMTFILLFDDLCATWGVFGSGIWWNGTGPFRV
jgi:hypothetical protein